MTGAAKDQEPIVLDYDLDAAPEKLWRALTDPALVAAWLAPNDIAANDRAAEVGKRFSLQTAPNQAVDCEVIEADPARKLSYRWREADGALDSIVTFEITPQPGGGSHLRLVHRELDAVGAGGLVGALDGGANDNRQFKGWSLAWAA
jgi:uncharacterized protein YndB with AHSA1/START domain